MLIYILLILSIVGFYFLFKDNKLYFCIAAGCLLFSLVAFRSIDMGILDTKNVYLPAFEAVQKQSILDIITNPDTNGKLFFVITKFITFLTTNYRIYLFLIGAPYITIVMYMIYKYSRQPLISTIIFISLYYLYSFFLLRQVIAMSILFLSYKFLKEKKLIPFCLLVFLATMIHQTAIIFLIAYPFCHFVKFGKKNYIMIFTCFALANIFPGLIYRIIELFDYTGKILIYIKYGIYDTSGGVSMFGLLVTVCMLIFAHFYKDKSSYEEDILFNLSTLGSMIFSFASIVSEFYRLSLFFSIFNILLVANYCVVEHRVKIKNYLMLGIVLASSAYFLTRSINNTQSNPYQFYWSDVE